MSIQTQSAEPPIAFSGPFATQNEHAIDASEYLRKAEEALASTAATFANEAISDARVRQRYAAGIQRVSHMIQQEVEAGRMSAIDGATYCNRLRNQILIETRKVSSTVGRAYATKMKPVGPTLQETLDRYSRRLYQKSFLALTDVEKSNVAYSVIQSAGRNDVRVTAATGKLALAGRVAILVTATLAVVAIASSEDKITETSKQGTVIMGGMLGAFLAGLGTSFVCGPAEPICALGFALVGMGAGTALTELAFDAYIDEIREFESWGLR
ncbi:hypothetical protein [Caballeronia sp. AZ1_KS37]|uniref:hypothetical protein n=1 Tax=Caballeronia sp. AZ1_KS37 TaxID=2921756 RepID=UPI0020282906|nr:hypothetical protein [Caballeronia sp. AZ1_KS37]